MKNNYPVFPQPLVRDGEGRVVCASDYGAGGIDLRTWLAAYALTGLIADSQRSGPWSAYAVDAVAFADALIAELNKPEKPSTIPEPS